MHPINSLVPLAANLAAQAISSLGSNLPFASFLDSGKATAEPSATLRLAPATDGHSRLQHEAMLQNIYRMRDQLHEKINLALRQRGVDTNEPIALTEDSDGRLLESSGNWDRTAIEQLLEENQEIASELRQLFRTVQGLRRVGLSAQGLSADEPLSPVRLWMDGPQASIQILS